jgi:quinol monooxygenase YgiN
MTDCLRLYQSALDPADVDEARRLFRDDVRPAFASAAGCRSIELVVSVDKYAGGLVDAVVVSRWASVQDMEEAVASRPVREGIVRFRQLLRREPVAKVFEIEE